MARFIVTGRGIAKRRIVLLATAWIGMLAGAVAAEPLFPAVDAEPLGTVSEDALVLHAGWQMRESAIAGDDGAAFSRAGFNAAGWYATSVPTTALGTLGPSRRLSRPVCRHEQHAHPRRQRRSQPPLQPQPVQPSAEQGQPLGQAVLVPQGVPLAEGVSGQGRLAAPGRHQLSGRRLAERPAGGRREVGGGHVPPVSLRCFVLRLRPEEPMRWPCAFIRWTFPATRSTSSSTGFPARSPRRRRRRNPSQRDPVLQRRLGSGSPRPATATWAFGSTSGWRRRARWRCAIRRP